MKLHRFSLPCAVGLATLASACVFVIDGTGHDEYTEGHARAAPKSAASGGNPTAAQARVAAANIDAAGVLAHIRALASDEFEGRAPGTHGEELSVEYLTRAFRDMGLAPGNPDGTYVQAVPLSGFKSEPRATLHAGTQAFELAFPQDCVALSRRLEQEIDVVDAPIVFVGYGIVAPEYGWDDYKGLDVRGKTIVMLVNDPGCIDPVDPALFNGRAMTYYGRWTYKYEIAAEKGAAAALIVHQTATAAYPWGVVSDSWGRENFDIEAPDRNAGRAAVEGWIALDTAKKLCLAAGHDFGALERAAQGKDFKPVTLDARASFHIANTVRSVASKNVLARLRGSDERLRDELIVYTAHWDHLGKSDKLAGDQIFNGAVDNASGVAGLLEIAQAYARLPVAPRRSVLFVAVTAEEKGLLGSRYYASHPLYPLSRTLANINMDGLNVWGRTSDIESVGYGSSTLDDVLVAAAAEQGRSVKPETEPEKGLYYRSDHFEFAKRGVPALDADGGSEFIGKPPQFGKEKREQYTAQRYHKPSDEVDPAWDLSGAVEDLRLLFDVGLRVSAQDAFPTWREGAEFKAARDAQLAARP